MATPVFATVAYEGTGGTQTSTTVDTGAGVTDNSVPKNEVETKDSGMRVANALATGDVSVDLASYINYKTLTEEDSLAIQYSFILSQLAKPFEESLIDVLQNDIVQQMRELDLQISNIPDVIDGDYVYVDLPEGKRDYSIPKDSFKDIYSTITKNLRYNNLVDESGHLYTVKTLLTNGISGKVGYLTDLIFTNSDSPVVSDAELKNNIDKLYSYDSSGSASNILDYIKNPNTLIGNDTTKNTRTQRRLVPVLLGTDTTDMYIQMGMMIHCKENSSVSVSMTFEKFLELHGNEQIYVDSYGNIVYYDVAETKYKNILPNACNTILTTQSSEVPKMPLFTEEYRDILKIDKVTTSAGEERENQLFLKDYADGNEFGYNFNVVTDGWNEKTFMYNKLLGSVYSTVRKSSDGADERFYYLDDVQDLNSAYYPAYIGPIATNRKDFRNSFVFMDSYDTYLMPSEYLKQDVTGVSTDSGWDTFWGWARGAISLMAAQRENHVQEYNAYTEDYDYGVLFPIHMQMNNAFYLAESGKWRESKDKPTSPSTYEGAILSTYWLYKNACQMGVLQTTRDSLLNTHRSMRLSEDKDGAIMFQIPDETLQDIENETLLGVEGGFLRDSKIIRTKTLGDNEAEKINDVLDTSYLLKRDNRLSNRYTQMPKDDFTILFYTWLQDYTLNTQISHYFSKQGEKPAVTGATSQLLSATFLEDIEGKDAGKNNWTGVAIPINPNLDNYEISGSTLDDVNYSDAYYLAKFIGKKDKAEMENGTSASDIDKVRNPYSNTVTVNPHATIMGLYRNTDPSNKIGALKYTEKPKEVDIVGLAKKVEFGIDNPITKLGNMTSGLSQTIHNALAVGSYNNALLNFVDSDMFSQIISWYAMATWALLFILLVFKIVQLIIQRKRVFQQLLSFSLAILMFVSVPYLFKYLQYGNKFVMDETTQTTLDKSTLITVQKIVSSLATRDVRAEQNYEAYRQQFENVRDVFAQADMLTIEGIDRGKLKVKEVSLEDFVKDIGVKTSTTIYKEGNGTVDDYMWYRKDKFQPVHSQEYAKDINLYFYDYLMYKYLEYYSSDDKANSTTHATANLCPIALSSCKEGSAYNKVLATQIATNIEKVLISTKGGLYEMFNDVVYSDSEDLIGVANLLNLDTVEGSPTTGYVKKYFNPINRVYTSKVSRFKTVTTDVMSTAYLEENTERNKYYSTYKQMEKSFDGMDLKVLPIDDDIHAITNSATVRIKNLLKFREGEFSDVALMYTSSIIIAEEFVKKFTGDEIGIKSTTDLDKILRVVYSKNIENIYNQEELMYIVQDSISGGSFITLLLVLYELMFWVVNFLNLIACVFVSIAFPIMLWKFKDSRGFQLKQLLGYILQIVLNVLSLFVVTVPLLIASELANKTLNDFTYWMLTLLMLGFGILAVKITFSCAKALMKDITTLGGAVITASAATMLGSISSALTNSDSVDANNSEMHVDGANVDINTEESHLDADSIDSVEYSGQQIEGQAEFGQDVNNSKDQLQPDYGQNTAMDVIQPESVQMSGKSEDEILFSDGYVENATESLDTAEDVKVIEPEEPKETKVDEEEPIIE